MIDPHLLPGKHDEILEAGPQFRRLPYGLTELGKDVPIPEVTPGTQRHPHHSVRQFRGCKDHELYRRILGIEAPWYVDLVELKVEGRRDPLKAAGDDRGSARY